MNLNLSPLKTLALVSLSLAITLYCKQVRAQDTTPAQTNPPIEQRNDVKITKPSDQQKKTPRIAPLPLTRPVEPGDRPTRTLNRFASVPLTESIETNTSQTNSHGIDECALSEIKRKRSESKKTVASKKANREKDCQTKSLTQ